MAVTEVNIRYNPYRLSTEIRIGGKLPGKDSPLIRKTSGGRLQSWVGELPEMLKRETGSGNFAVTFHGNRLDFDDMRDSFENARRAGVLSGFKVTLDEAVGDSGVFKGLLSVYKRLMNTPAFVKSISPEDKKGLENAIRRVMNNIFPIHVIATMSSGKSTLINAFMRKKLMPSKNEACTAIITEILDNDRDGFSAIVYDRGDNMIKTVPQLTYEIMNELNGDKNVSKVCMEGDIPFLDVIDMALCLVDTPGPNNARNANHRETTYRNINCAAENMILYVLNYTQLATNDDESLLRYAVEEIKKGGKETRDRFLFVLNKMDEVRREDSVEHAIEVTRDYFARHGIDDPQIFPCSAFVALGLRTLLKDVDPYDEDSVENAAREYQNDDVFDFASLVRKMNRKGELHLEKYSSLTPSEKEKLDAMLERAVAGKDRKTEALIHSGICSIESAVTAYVHKYAKAKKIKDFAESLENQLHQTLKESKARLAAVSGGREAEDILKRSAAIKEMIDKGEEAKRFKSQIESIDPIGEITRRAGDFLDKANNDIVRRFKGVGSRIEGRQQVLNFVNAYSDDAADVFSDLSAQLEVLIRSELQETGESLVKAYRAKLDEFDKGVGASLDFSTSDLVNGVLSRMKDEAFEYESGGMKDRHEEIVDDIHEDEVEEYTVEVVKTRKVRETVQDGVDKIKTGEERVVVGSRRVRTGTRRVQVKRGGWFGWIGDFFSPKYEYEDVYETIEDVEYRPTYKYVPRMREIIREIPTVEQEIRRNKLYVVNTSDLQRRLVTPVRKQLKDDVDGLLNAAKEWIRSLKDQFIETFDEIDEVIRGKYSELEELSRRRDELNERIDAKRLEYSNMISFVEDNANAIRSVLDV